jgi:aromatic ring hydroxylase
MGNEWQTAKDDMGIKSSRTKRTGAGERHEGDRNNYCEIQTIRRVSVGSLHREKKRGTELQVCNIASLPFELNCPNTDIACTINTFLQTGNAEHRSKILRLSPNSTP